MNTSTVASWNPPSANTMGNVPNVNTNVSAAPINTAGYTCGMTTS